MGTFGDRLKKIAAQRDGIVDPEVKIQREEAERRAKVEAIKPALESKLLASTRRRERWFRLFEVAPHEVSVFLSRKSGGVWVCIDGNGKVLENRVDHYPSNRRLYRFHSMVYGEFDEYLRRLGLNPEVVYVGLPPQVHDRVVGYEEGIFSIAAERSEHYELEKRAVIDSSTGTPGRFFYGINLP